MSLFDYELEESNYKDWRLPENRMELFRRYTNVLMLEGDIDHWHHGKVIASEMNLTDKQKLFYCLIFGQSYRSHWPMIILQKFPNFLETSVEEINEFVENNSKRCFYATDTLKCYRNFVGLFKDLKERYENIDIIEHFEKLTKTGNPITNFNNLTEELQSLHGYGRMGVWLTKQMMYEFFDYDIDIPELQLENQNSWSQWNALCWVLNKEEWQIIKKTKNTDINRLLFFEEKVKEIYHYCNDNSIIHIDIYNLETCLCQLRKTIKHNPLFYQLYVNTNKIAELYDKLYYSWEGEINFKPFVIAMNTKGKFAKEFAKTKKEYSSALYDKGLNFDTHTYYKDEPNSREIMGFNLEKSIGGKLCVSHYNEWFDEKERIEFETKYNPRNMLKFTGNEDKNISLYEL
jgi:hypothetical protein